jgi:hypothetical protein
MYCFGQPFTDPGLFSLEYGRGRLNSITENVAMTGNPVNCLIVSRTTELHRRVS